MTRDSIFMDYRNLMARADRLEELAAELRRSAEAIGEGNEADQWRGDAGREYRTKKRQLHQKALAHADQISRTVFVMRQAATVLYNAEQRAMQIIR